MIVGLEISGDTVRAVRLGRARAGGAAQTAELPLDAGRVPIAKLAETLGVRHCVWGVAVPSSWCLYRTISLPYNAPGRVAATFRYALEGRLAGSVEEYCIDALSEPRAAGEKGCRLTVAACPKEKVRDLVMQLKEAGAHPCVVQPAVLALARRLGSAAPNALIVRIGQEAELAVMQQGELVAAEVLSPLPAEGLNSPAGAAAFAERLRFALSAMELSWGQFAFERCILIRTDARPGSAGTRHALPLQPNGDKPCEGLNEPSQGGAADGPAEEAHLKAALSAATGLAVEPPPEETGGAAFAAAWGIAAQAEDKAHLAPSLLQGEFAHPAHALRYERRAAVALGMAIGIVLLLGVWSVRQLIDAHTAESAGQRREMELYSQVVPTAKGAPSLDAMKGTLARLEKQGAGAGGDHGSAVGSWMELIRLTPPDITLESIDINTKRIALRARCKERGRAWELQKVLGKSALLLPSPPSELRTAEGGVTTFAMEVRYK